LPRAWGTPKKTSNFSSTVGVKATRWTRRVGSNVDAESMGVRNEGPERKKRPEEQGEEKSRDLLSS